MDSVQEVYISALFILFIILSCLAVHAVAVSDLFELGITGLPI